MINIAKLTFPSKMCESAHTNNEFVISFQSLIKFYWRKWYAILIPFPLLPRIFLHVYWQFKFLLVRIFLFPPFAHFFLIKYSYFSYCSVSLCIKDNESGCKYFSLFSDYVLIICFIFILIILNNVANWKHLFCNSNL